MKKLTFFVYYLKGAACFSMSLHRALHGRREIRVSKDEFWRVKHKTFEYPGIPHRDIIPGAFFVSARDENDITEFFDK